MELTSNRNFFRVWLDRKLIWIMTGTVLSVLPHVPRIPVWITLLFFLFVAWRLLQSDEKTTTDTVLVRLVRLTLAGCMFIGIFFSYGTLVGRDAGIALLIALAGMKISEIRLERDYYITSFISFFLVMTNFFYSQTILTALYMVVCVIFILFSLIDFNDSDRVMAYEDKIKYAGSLLLQSLPLMLILFLMFPRIPGPLWGLPKDAHSGLTGLDDEMTPGSISDLTLSNEVAFRVEFTGTIPDKSQLYWRGPVLWHTDGTTWTRDKIYQQPARVTFKGQPISYTVLMEPSDQRWLFTLEMAGAAPSNGYFTHDRQIRTRKAIVNRVRYESASWLDYEMRNSYAGELVKALQLPQGFHSRTIELAQSWQQQGLSPQLIINRALRMFNEQEFYYSLTPPLLPLDPVDQFLFESREGFCEHYSAAFVVLMRAAGVPARVVTGYQGGVINPIGNYLIVRQRDAHAWAEVWLEERGWVRVDPTSAVSPLRINQGIETALPNAMIDIPLGFNDNNLVRDIWMQFRNRWDALNNTWNKWVMGYDQKRQSLFLKKLGLERYDWQALLLGLGMLLLMMMLVVAVILFRNRNVHDDEARKLYDNFCKKLAKVGVLRGNHEGPQDFARRVQQLRPDLADTVNEISLLYIAIRYDNKRELLQRLNKMTRSFSPLKTATT